MISPNEKLRLAIKCLRLIAKYGRGLPSDGMAKEALSDMDETEEEPIHPAPKGPSDE